MFEPSAPLVQSTPRTTPEFHDKFVIRAAVVKGDAANRSMAPAPLKHAGHGCR